jgi:uncharacterized protein
VIVADTGAIIALVDANDRHHEVVRELYEAKPSAWVLPWAILPEVDYILLQHLGLDVQLAFLDDVADGRFVVEWGDEADVARARELCVKYRRLELGLTDGIVMATAERMEAEAIATVDIRDFGAAKLRGSPRLLPRDR